MTSAISLPPFETTFALWIILNRAYNLKAGQGSDIPAPFLLYFSFLLYVKHFDTLSGFAAPEHARHYIEHVSGHAP